GARGHSGTLGGGEAAADRDDEGPRVPEGAGTAGLPDRVVLYSPARHRRRGGPGVWVLRHAHRQHPSGYSGPGVPGAVERAAARRRRRLRGLAPDRLLARPPGLEDLSGRGVALRVARSG